MYKKGSTIGRMFMVVLLFVCAFLSSEKTAAQKQKYDSLTRLLRKTTLEFLDLKTTDSIADIGTGTGYSLAQIAGEYPGVYFTVEDIDSSECNRKKMLKEIRRWGNKANIDQFSFHYGTETSTGLPANSYNKVMMFNLVHELTYKTEMLNDIRKILSSEGVILAEEILVRKKTKKDKNCNYPYLTEDEFKKVMADNKFILKREKMFYDSEHNRYLKLFEYSPENNNAVAILRTFTASTP